MLPTALRCLVQLIGDNLNNPGMTHSFIVFIVTEWIIPGLGQNFFISQFTNPPTVIFLKVEKKFNFLFLFYPPTLNIICFVEKNNIFLRFCLCIFESDTVKRDCPVLIFRKIMNYLKI